MIIDEEELFMHYVRACVGIVSHETRFFGSSIQLVEIGALQWAAKIFVAIYFLILLKKGLTLSKKCYTSSTSQSN